MGTSGAWGGSQTQRWQQARQLLDQLPDPGPPDPQPPPDTDPLPELPPLAADALLQAIAAGLIGDDPAATGDPAGRPLPTLAALVGPRRPGRGRTGGGGGAAGASGGGGGGGGGGRRQLGRAAQRGGVAIGAAYALRRGDAAALAEVGLNLAELQAMSPRTQRMALLNAILGQPDHPDDVAVRRAADEQLRELLTTSPDGDPDPLDLLRGFVGKLIHQVAVVELVDQLDRGAADQTAALRKERRIGEWIRARLRRERFGATGALVALVDFQRVAARLLATSLSILRSP
jgi:hypothetical protein